MICTIKIVYCKELLIKKFYKFPYYDFSSTSSYNLSFNLVNSIIYF